MPDLIADLAASGFPTLPLSRCMGQYPDLAPRLRTLLDHVAAGAVPSAAQRVQVFYALHILGAGRDRGCCPALLRLLRRDGDELDALLGDALRETLPRILIGVFDGDAEAYFALAGDAAVDGAVRHAVLGAIAFLTWEGRIGHEQTIRFLDRFDRDRCGGEAPAAWQGWQTAVALLGLRGLAPQVAAAHRDGRLAEEGGFSLTLAEAEAAPQEARRFAAHKLGYIHDLVAALEWVAENRLELCDPTIPDAQAGFSPDSVYDDFDDDFDDELDGFTDLTTKPVANPWRHLG
jgi:hypothetical protein